MTLQSLEDDIKATKQRLAGDYEHLRRSPSSSQEAQCLWKALQIAAKKEIILMICQTSRASLGRTLWATLSYKGCQPSEWSSFLSELLEHLDDRSKCEVQSFLSRERLPWVHPTVRQRFWADLMTLMREAQNDPGRQNRVWQVYCSNKHSYFEDPSANELSNTVYFGYLCGRFKGELKESKWGHRVTVKPNATVSLAAWLAPQNTSGAYSDHIASCQGRLRPEISVRFSVDESEAVRSTPRSQAVSFAVWDNSPEIDFEVLAPQKLGLHTVWIEVFENNRKLSSLPLDLVVAE